VKESSGKNFSGRQSVLQRMQAIDRKLGKQTSGASGNAKGDRALGLVPIVVAVLFAALILPRPVVPTDVPLPQADLRKVEAVFAADHQRVLAAERAQPSSLARSVGSALSDFFALQTKNVSDEDLKIAHDDLLQRLNAARTLIGDEPLVQLRALNAEEFLVAVDEAASADKRRPGAPRFASTAKLESVAGPFAPRMAEAGFLRDGVLHLSRTELHVLYRALWTATLGLSEVPAFAPALDEIRVRYALLLREGHPSRRDIPRLQGLPSGVDAFASASDTPALRCARQARRDDELQATWLAEKIGELGAVDPVYPTRFALGIVDYRRGQYDTAAANFRAYEEQSPNGPWSLRAANFLRAAVREAASK
jgi:hypothetical protein